MNEKDQAPLTFWRYLLSSQSYWFWLIITLAIATTVIVLTVSEHSYPLVYTRYVLGSIFVLFLPGYTFIKTLFPAKELNTFERIALSMGLSLALVPVIVLLLDYTPWGIGINTVTLSLLASTIIFTMISSIREYQNKLEKQVLQSSTV